jgi:hypothetical protein
MPKELRTVLDASRTPVLQIVKEEGMLVIYEADDMDRQIQFSASVIPALISYLEELK